MTIQDAYKTICDLAPSNAICGIDVEIQWRNRRSEPRAQYTISVAVPGREMIIEVLNPSLLAAVDMISEQLKPSVAPVALISECVERLAE